MIEAHNLRGEEIKVVRRLEVQQDTAATHQLESITKCCQLA